VAQSAGIGHGTSFTVRLPRIAAPAVTTTTTGGETMPFAADGRELVGMAILLVDDDVDAGGAVAQLLTLEGAAVTLAHSVADAVRALTAQAFDVAVSDIAMPEQDGFDFLRAVRRHRPELPVIALTAFASDRDRQRVLAAGFQGFLSKPVEAMRLYDALRQAVRQARRRQSARA
jgi:CheY-like chemotaxis protein